MLVTMILLPVIVHVAFVFVLLFWGLRSSARVGAGRWRDELALPVLFYVLTICAWQTRFADLVFLVLAWIFVALRILDTVGFGPADRPPDRAPLFLASAIVLAVMWIVYVVRLLLLS